MSGVFGSLPVRCKTIPGLSQVKEVVVHHSIDYLGEARGDSDGAVGNDPGWCVFLREKVAPSFLSGTGGRIS